MGLVGGREGLEVTGAAGFPHVSDALGRAQRFAGAHISEKICMTARQWHQASDDTARALDRAQRTTGGTDGN